MMATHRDIHSTPVTIASLGSNIFAFALYLTWVWRFYLLMYDMCWIIAAKNDHWQNIINPTYKESTASSFIQRKKTYGSPKWTFYHLFLPTLFTGILLQNFGTILVLCDTKMTAYDHDLAQTMDYFVGIIPYILLVIIYCKIPSFRDKFYIHAELSRILTAITIQYMAFFTTVCIRLFFEESSIWLISYFISILCEFTAMSFATMWVATKVESIIDQQSYHIRQFESKSMNEYISIDSPRNTAHEYSHHYTERTVTRSYSSNRLLKNQRSGQHTKTRRFTTKDQYTLEQLLSTNQSFSLFMVQLAHEFSQECLLSMVEMIQFQQLLVRYINTNNLGILRHRASVNQSCSQLGQPNPNREYYECITFPTKVPKSYIVYGAYEKYSSILLEEEFDIHCNETDFIEKCKIMVKKIYEKYISAGSQFQINIPWTVNRTLQKTLQNNTNWTNDTEEIQIHKLLHIFDECIVEMYSLMMDSYRRFRKTQRYMTLQLSVDGGS